MITPSNTQLDQAEVAAFRIWVAESMAHAGDCSFWYGKSKEPCNCARSIADRLAAECQAKTAKVDALQAFKDWVHNYLDAHGVPHHPPGTHGEHGCRIGDRMDWLMAQLAAANARLEELSKKLTQALARIQIAAEGDDTECQGYPMSLAEAATWRCRSERDALAKRLAEAEAEVTRLRDKLKYYSHGTID